MTKTSEHRWRFFRAGGFDQVRIESGADVLALRNLDQKLWVALACPTQGIHFDPRTLELMDEDKDGRIRAPEFIQASEWVGKVLIDCADLPKAKSSLALSNIRQDTPEGALFHQAAQAVLRGAGKADALEISVEDAAKAVDAFNGAGLNGDGVITELSATGDPLRQVIADLIATVGSVPDRSGKPGVNKELILKFYVDARAHLAWLGKAEGNEEIRILGDKTAAARQRLSDVQAKVEDYFARCRLAAFDARAAAPLNGDEKTYAQLAPRALVASMEEIAALPLAQVAPNKPLPLREGTNPAWSSRLEALAEECVTPLLGKKSELSEADWQKLLGRFAAWDAWMKDKQGASVEKLGEGRLRALADGDSEKLLLEISAQDLALEPVASSLASIEKLVRLHRDLYRLANNFVSFRDFYSQEEKATFQAGTLYIDERSLDLCVRVADANKHAELGGMSRMYLAYCECRRRGEKMTIAAAFTNGDSDNLMVGRNGVFYDRDGNDWDATITKIITNPISVRQAFFAPYKKLIRFVEEMVAKRAAAADERAGAKLTTGAVAIGDAAETGKVAPPPAAKPKVDIGTVAALGVAVGGITAALGALFGALLGLGWLMPLGLLAFVLAISGPSMLIAWLKLRQRNLSALLDANGWAINAPARVNIPFGQKLSQLRRLPPGASLNLIDPYAQKKRSWWAIILAVLAGLTLVAWLSGRIDFLLPEPIQRDRVLGLTPEAVEPAPPSPPATP